MRERSYWIGVASKDHVDNAFAGGFTQLNHGKAAPLERNRLFFRYWVAKEAVLKAQGIGLGFPLGIRSIVLPVGISFFTFMAISYIVDIYRGELEPASLTKFGAYLSFFPHLVAGPIVRGSELLPQLETPRDPRRVDTSRAFYLIATGLFKKVVIADNISAVAAAVLRPMMVVSILEKKSIITASPSWSMTRKSMAPLDRAI